MLCPSCGQEIGDQVQLCPRCATGEVERPIPMEQTSSLPFSKRLTGHPLIWWAVLLLCLSAVLLILAFGGWSPHARRHPPGILAPNPPLQETTSAQRSWEKDGYRIQSLARFQLKARVLLTSRYYISSGADLSPLDITFGWGPLSDQAIVDQISLSNGYRDYRWWAKRPPLPMAEMNRHMANMHLIPADDAVLATLKKAVPGDIVTLRGHLVFVTRPDGFKWKSSLTREDSGGGACEVVWVDSVSIAP